MRGLDSESAISSVHSLPHYFIQLNFAVQSYETHILTKRKKKRERWREKQNVGRSHLGNQDHSYTALFEATCQAWKAFPFKPFMRLAETRIERIPSS